MSEQHDMFSTGHANKIIGLRVQLDRPVDREKPCCRNLCTIGPGKGPHAGALHCANCEKSRGWISGSAALWITFVVKHCGPPPVPITVHKSSAEAYEQFCPPAAAGAGARENSSAPRKRR